MSRERKEPKKPKTTAEAQIPGAFEGETVSRRRFMTGTVHAAGGIAVAAFTLPAVGLAVGPIFEKQEERWESVGPIGDFADDTYIPRTLTLVRGIGDVGKSTVYIRKYSTDLDDEERDEFNEFIAISTRCMHLGCPVRFVEASERFICPCHGGVYDFQGKVAGGPPVRPLDRFYTRVRNGNVEVGPRFSVNSELERFSPRDPGMPLDGIGQYVYPARPSVRKIPGT
ncbi:MAG TPA: ubiquinol-cytochrome c reductase iron-sulfur subunit [Solirubrobacteraceae bacterium]|nr:ubiquinol-cytochrome c reductase iron-sulfur subunit [Solirubrobacteraceae bacterium]